MDSSRVINTYAADGTKLRSVYRTNAAALLFPVGRLCGQEHTACLDRVVDYRGQVRYEEDGERRESLVFNPEGYYSASDSAFFAFQRDYQGNVARVWKMSDGAGFLAEPVLAQRNEYFADGTPAPRTAGAGLQPFKYNGNEWIRSGGLDAYDFNARLYHPAAAQFSSQDPLAENYYATSPYAFCGGNPVRYSDPTGMAGESQQDIYNRNRYDNNGVYVPPCARKGGVNAQGYADPTYGMWQQTTVQYADQLSWIESDPESSGGYTPVVMPVFRQTTRHDFQWSNKKSPDTNLEALFFLGYENNALSGIGAGYNSLGNTNCIGSNGRVYSSNFHGNQYVRVTKLGPLSKQLGNASFVTSIGLSAAEAGYRIYQNGGVSGIEKDLTKVGMETAFGLAGSAAGGSTGATIGATVGSAIPGAGTAVGAIIGGAIGAVLGGFGGTYIGDAVINYLWR